MQHLASIEAAVLRLRVLLRIEHLGPARDAIECALPVVLRSDDLALRATFWMLAGTVFHRLHDPEPMANAFAAARGYAFCIDDNDVLGELAYYEAMLAWSEGAPDEARRIVQPAFAAPSCSVRALGHALVGVTAAARGDFEAQLAHIEDAWLTLSEDFDRNAYQAAHTLFASVALAVELGHHRVADQAAERLQWIGWNDDLAYLRFEVVRNLAWSRALQGDHLGAFRLWRESAGYAPSPVWNMATLVDRTFLAFEMGQPLFGREELAQAHALAAKIDWDATSGDERFELLSLANVTSTIDPAASQRILQRYRAIPGAVSPRSLYQSENAERTAWECFDEGLIALRCGERALAQALLSRAFELYRKFGFVRRATQAAVHLAQLTGGDEYRGYAREHAPRFAQSWLARAAEALDREACG